ncbi:hypothetical protein [Pelagicoccus mobilis]|uniref:Vitamin B12 dependent methionine synthase, activation domain n=1 Tax=Pelagicoccus mobilis TaxID=415221 RepID=A0A934RU56_9BACT|nr:hypothetical protein [Pelagicoccus mobilis]MBK1875460.1 hypothetical protein [Pelagicoccus mobilis]
MNPATMETQIEILELSPLLEEEALLLSMGIPKGAPVKKRLQRHVVEALDIVSSLAKPKALWKIASTESVLRSFTPSRRLTRYLQAPEYAALVVGTAGAEWEERIHSTEDPMRAYILNTAATALARDTHQQVSRALAQRYPQFLISESVSPGIGGLPFRLQAELIQQLPIEKIGVRFNTESQFMQPMASVTSIIGFGNKVEKAENIDDCTAAEPHCPHCPDPNCTLRVLPFQRQKSPALQNA